MKIALDYDKTFTADKALFTSFVRLVKSKGHEIRFVTFRKSNKPNLDIKSDARRLGIKIIFTDEKQKSPSTINQGWKPDIWVDDDPSKIPGSTGLSSISSI
ncbi:hypothetical protein [Salinivibrio kushneri]|uniref:hypothetical protein n=1 Tax=Salinivibrio kushneri TaxID=1908198 RepID=UPI000988C07B|nr:hypothetical protein [Salinivibrio kushneri]OOE63658.1 hypothetical protein BZG19_16055 [Salinivibrio kushneri]